MLSLCDGWLLMISEQPGDKAKAYLIKPRAGQRINLPIIPHGNVGSIVFSVVSGVPDVIVCFDHESTYQVL